MADHFQAFVMATTLGDIEILEQEAIAFGPVPARFALRFAFDRPAPYQFFQAFCVFQTILGTDFRGSWAVISREAGQ